MCELDIAACTPDVEIDTKLKALREIRSYLDAAKAKVETCHQPANAMSLYNYALKLLAKFDCATCK